MQSLRIPFASMQRLITEYCMSAVLYPVLLRHVINAVLSVP